MKWFKWMRVIFPSGDRPVTMMWPMKTEDFVLMCQTIIDDAKAK